MIAAVPWSLSDLSPDPVALVVTALEKEADAVAAHLEDQGWHEHPAGSQYRTGSWQGSVTTWRIVIVETGRGNEDAAVATNRALDYLAPKIALFVGVAGGLKDVKIGDVVAATEVLGFEYGKEDVHFLPRLQFGKSTFRLAELAKRVRSEARWQHQIRGSHGAGPEAILGPIAAGSKVVANAKSPSASLLRTNCSHALAVEMEGLGFLQATFQSPRIDALVVRGISDLLDGKAEADGSGSQERAAAAAAAFAFELLRSYRTESEDPSGPSHRTPVAASLATGLGESGAGPAVRGSRTGSRDAGPVSRGESTGSSGNLVFIGHSPGHRPAEDLDPGDSMSKHQHRKRYLAALVQDVEKRLRGAGYDVWVDDDVAPGEALEYHVNLGMLTSNIAVVLIDRDALASPHVRREMSVLLWLRSFGLPVLPVALGDVTSDAVMRSPLGEVASLQQLKIMTFPNRKQNSEARAAHVAMICEAIADARPRQATSPTARWVQDMAHFLAAVPDARLPTLGERLGVSHGELARPGDPRGALAAALLGSDVDRVWWCLRDAVEYLDHEAKEAVVTRTAPIWVDLETARLVLDVVDLPEGHRVCGFEMTALRLGDNIVKRATASASEYTTVRVPDAVGEEAGKELLERYDRTLRNALHLSHSDTPDTICRELAAYHAAVFALVRCTGMNPQVTRNLLSRLGQRFPGIAFILLADPDSPIWHSMPEVRRSSRRWTRDDDLAARRHVSRLYSLIGKDIPVDSDG
jgi:nucleoside phosphorylase